VNSNKLINSRKYTDSLGNTLLESILTNSRREKHNNNNSNNHRNNKSQLYPLNTHNRQSFFNNNGNSVPTVLQLPNNVLIVNRSNEEQAISPDKLILERYLFISS
jgi:hypothetical protein